MKSLIFRSATEYLLPLIVLFSVFLLLDGHHEPGGGFVGGLILAAAVALYVLAFGVAVAKRILPVGPHGVIGAGLLVSAASGAWPLLEGRPFLTGEWGVLRGRNGEDLHVGTPLLFDFGVYLVVTGVVLMIVFAFAEAEEASGGASLGGEATRRGGRADAIGSPVGRPSGPSGMQ